MEKTYLQYILKTMDSCTADQGGTTHIDGINVLRLLFQVLGALQHYSMQRSSELDNAKINTFRRCIISSVQVNNEILHRGPISNNDT